MFASYLKRAAWLAAALLVMAPVAAGAQYFGRNKVQYRSFDFQVLKTEHFDLYYYPEEAEAAAIVSRMAERWHERLSRFFGHELRGRQPLILYAVGAHFRQTNAVEGLIGEGTGGLTEALKRRVVLPVGGSLADTDHVLGHELVHAFQFDLTGADPREKAIDAPAILTFPLWFVEGMAEYLSLGPTDTQTAMWMRDAALSENLPHVRDLDHPRYFPYRWGHAFWSYVGATYGDRTVASLIRSAANPRYDLVGLMRQLGTDPDAFTAAWHNAIRLSARGVADGLPSIHSRATLAVAREKDGVRYNLGPEVSPDGTQIVFFSERDRFSMELYLADAASGRVIRKLLHTATDPHFDSLEFLSSAGAWSPDGQQLALTAIRGGRPVLVVLDIRNGRLRREIALPGLHDAVNPSYAPDGRSIALSGNRGGLVDLYVLHLETGALDRLTDDAFADLQPVFTPDGRSIVFATERFSTDLVMLQPGAPRLAVIDLDNRAVRPLAGFLRGKHINPKIAPDGRSVYFIADPDGVSNVYRIPVDGGPAERITAVATGIAGITGTSPALSVATRTGRLVFSLFENEGHAIYVLDPSDVVALVAPDATAEAAVLPGRATAAGDVHVLLADSSRGLPEPAPMHAEPYREELSLDTFGQPTVSAGVSQNGGGFVSGGMSAFFTDMLGDRALGVAGAIAGDVRDLGAELFYMNRRHRWNWAASLYVRPYRIGYYSRTDDISAGEAVLVETIERQPRRGAFASAAYPLSSASRVEVTGGAEALSFSRDIRTATYDLNTRHLIAVTEEQVSLGNTLYLGTASAAIVHDTSFFGVTSPVFGTRYRVEVGRTAGSLQFTTALVDWRRYFLPKGPFTVAVRGLHFGRYGRGSEDPQLLDLYLGYPEFVHGYGPGSFSAAECLRGTEGADCDVFLDLLGSRMVVANIEVRAPLVGLFRGRLEYGRIPIEIAAFADAGVTWTRDESPAFLDGSRQLVRSAGGAVRVNLLGLVAVELSAARPIDRPSKSLQWQVGIRQGF